MHDRGDGIEEGEGGLIGAGADGFGERGRGEGPGGHDHAVPVLRRQAGDLAAGDLDQRGGLNRGGDGLREAVAIHRQRAAGGQLVAIGAAHDQRAEPAHLGVQHADCVRGLVIRAEGIGADQLGKPVGLVGIGAAFGPHLVQHHGHAAPGELPGRFRARKPPTDHMNRAHRHCHSAPSEYWRGLLARNEAGQNKTAPESRGRVGLICRSVQAAEAAARRATLAISLRDTLMSASVRSSSTESSIIVRR